MTNKFRNFLKQNALYDNYVRNNNGESSNTYVYFDNFHWETSPEGYDYWSYWDSIWFDILTEEDERK